jgi:SH3-like domain-containing protein
MKTKSLSILPLIFILFASSALFGEKPGEVEVTVPIIKLHALPSAESDTKGFAYTGQHYVIDGESGDWLRIRFKDASNAWVTRDAVNILTPYDAGTDQAASPTSPIVAQRSATGVTGPAAGSGNGGERVVAPAPQLAVNKTADQGATMSGAQQHTPMAAGNTAPGYQSGVPAKSPATAATVIAYTGKAAVSAQKTAAVMPSAGGSAAATKAKSTPGPGAALQARQTGTGISAAGGGTASSPLARTGVDPLHPSAPGTPVAASASASPFARPLAPGTDGSPAMHATAASPLAAAPQGGGAREVAAVNESPGRSTPEEVEAALIRGGGRAMAPLKKRTWFSQFSNLGKTQSGREIAFFQVADGRSAVYAQASTDAGVLITAEKGDFFPLLEETAAWCKVALKDTTGWIERNKGIVVSTPSSGLSEEWSFIVIVLASLAVVAALLFFLRHKARARKRAAEKKIGEGSALEGDIAESNLPEILQFIEIGKKTGCLQIEDKSPLGIIYFMGGRIIHAAAVDNIAGREAVNYILGLQQGSFRFLLDKHPKVRDLDLSTIEVLMEWTKTEDEAHRH